MENEIGHLTTQSTMAENRNQQNEQSGLIGSRRKYLILFISKLVLGIILLILGSQAVRYTSGQRGTTFGPSYYIGAFIVGCADSVAGLVDMLVYCRRRQGSDNAKEMSQYIGIECLITVIAIIGGFIGVLITALFGIPDCEPSNFGSFCNYTVNMSENRSIATAILLFLIVSEILNIGSIIVQLNKCKSQGRNTQFRTPYTPQQYPLNSGNSCGINYGNVVTAPPPETAMYVGGHGRHRDYEGFSRDRQIIVDGNVMDTHGGGFSGAIIQPSPVTVIHPPTGFPQYSDQRNESHLPPQTGARGYTTNESVSDLQEQNRLLREQIALQQQQMELQEHIRSSSTAPPHPRSPAPPCSPATAPPHPRSPAPPCSSSTAPPPPSYESCVKDPSQIRYLQDQNRKPQGSDGHMMTSHNDENVQPSAPPL